MDISTLAPLVVSAVVPLFQKGAEKFAEKNAEEGFEQRGRIWSLVKGMFIEAETNPNAYLPFVAMTLNNLAVLHKAQNKYDEALNEYEEALRIRKELFEKMPDAYAPDYSTTLINLAIFYQKAVSDREKSVDRAIEATFILLPIVEKVPYTEKYLETASNVLQDWGLNVEEIGRLVEEKQSGR